MKKRRLLLLVAALTMLIVNAKADTLDVCRPWNATFNQMPIHGAYSDYGFRTEFIYPSRMLTEMGGGVITELTFYAANDSLTYNETFTLYMEEVTDTICSTSGWQMSSEAQQVWSGTVSVSNHIWHLTLDSAFAYSGGHLLMSFHCAGMTGGLWSTSSFRVYHFTSGLYRSVYADANSGHEMPANPTNGTLALPSATFTYWSAASLPCHSPLAVQLDSVWPHGAIISWDSVDGSLGYEWTLTHGVMPVASGQTTAVNVTIPGLDMATDYTFRIHTLCDSGEVSQDKVLTFMTACGTITAADMPFVEDFESYSTTTYTFEIPCWTLLAYSRGQWLRVEPTTEGNNLLSLWPDDNSAPQFAVMPEMQNISALNMNFKVRGLIGAVLQVGVMTDPNDTLTFVPMAVFDSINVRPAWIDAEVDFSSFSGTTGHIAFRAGLGPTWTQRFLEIDDIAVSMMGNCSQMQGIAISNVTATTADLTINDTAPAGATYIVTLVSDNGTVQTLTLSTLNSTLSTLTPITDYTVTVQKRCSDSTAHVPMTATFHTTCAPIADLPWSESFEDCGTDIPECWSTINRNGNNLSIASAVGYSSGQRSLSGYSRHTPEMLVLLPEFDLSPDSLMLSLEVMRYQHGTDTALGVEVGIITNPADASTFVPTAVCIPTGLWSWEHYTATFPGYTSGRIAIRYLHVANVSETAHTFVDNITVEPLPASLPDTCVQPTVLVSNIRGDGAVLHISSPMAMPHYMLYVDGDSVEIFSSLYTVTGLAADSLYTVGVSSICADGSRTSRTEVQFRTALCPLQPLPWSEDFDGVSTSNTDVAAALPCWARCGQGTANVSNVYGTSNNRIKLILGTYQHNNIVVLPDLQGDINNMEMSFTSAPFYPYNSTTQILQVGYTTSPTDTASFRPLASFNAADYVINYNTQPRTEYVAFSGVPYGARIALRVPEGDMTLEWYIDDIEVHEVQSCPRPQSVTVMHIGADTADLFITDTNPGQTYIVTVASDNGTVQTFTLSALNSTLSTLTPATDYTVSVRVLCPDSSLTAAVSCQFHTMCQPLTYADMPYVLDFEDYPAGYIEEPCWLFYKLLSDASIVEEFNLLILSEDDPIFSAAQSGTHYLTIGAGFNTPIYWVLPAVETLSDKVLQFGYRSGYGAHVSYNYRADIGVMSDPFDPATFVLLDSIVSVADTYQTVAIDMVDYTGAGQYIAIINHSDGGLVIDDLSISVSVVPPEPPAPLNLQLLSVDSLSATVSWQPGGDETHWQIELSSDTVQYLQHSISSYQSSVLYTLTDLAPLTTYSLRVAAVSDNDKISEWSLPLEFTTLDTVHDSIPDVGISTLSTLHSPLLYPNPSHGSVTIEVGEPAVITLFDLTGYIVDTYRTENPQLHIEGLTAGAYFVRIVTSTGVTTRKLVVK